MSLRQAERLAAERLRLLELEAAFQRSELAHTFHGWEKRKALAWGARIAGWGFRLFAQPKIRLLVATTLLSRLKRRRAH
jgi:hypothetical protein